MTSLVEKIDLEVARRSLLNHPFYQMWSKGELSREHLSGYAKEYFQLVKAVPEMVENAQRWDSLPKISENEAEEKEHVKLWIRFAYSLGISESELVSYAGEKNANHAVSQLGMITSSTFEEAVAALYAYELEIPKISKTKMEGLSGLYGLDSDDAMVYFRAHEEADVRHAAVWRDILNGIQDEKKKDIALKAAVKSLEAQNKLLDSVMEKYVLTN